jgi:hypothetical protein
VPLMCEISRLVIKLAVIIEYFLSFCRRAKLLLEGKMQYLNKI